MTRCRTEAARGRVESRPAPRRARIVAIAILALVACDGGTGPEGPGPGNGGPGILILRVFDLGENENGGGGDALLVTDSTAAGQRHILLDAGPAGPGGLDLDHVADRLDALGVDTLEALVLSHAHSDHFDGMSDVLARVHVRDFYYNGQVRNFARYTTLVAQAFTDAESRITLTQPIEFDLGTGGDTHIRILPPLLTYLNDPNAGSAEINEGSLGTRITRGAFSLFVAGDGEVEANLRWRTMFADDTRNVTALKVGHHGANDAIFDNGSFGASEWLEHTNPVFQLVSANGTSHPRIRALTALLLRAVQTYCTNVHGDITVRIDDSGEDRVVSVQRNAGAICMPGRDATTWWRAPEPISGDTIRTLAVMVVAPSVDEGVPTEPAAADVVLEREPGVEQIIDVLAHQGEDAFLVAFGEPGRLHERHVVFIEPDVSFGITAADQQTRRLPQIACVDQELEIVRLENQGVRTRGPPQVRRPRAPTGLRIHRALLHLTIPRMTVPQPLAGIPAMRV